jgi:hypothetical protein
VVPATAAAQLPAASGLPRRAEPSLALRDFAFDTGWRPTVSAAWLGARMKPQHAINLAFAAATSAAIVLFMLMFGK